MKKPADAHALDVKAFARSGGVREQEDRLADHARLIAEAVVDAADRLVHWRAEGQERTLAGQPAQPWLHLQAQAAVPLTCQRCLEPVDVPLSVDRWFRFVADEATAEREDEESEEDVLVLDKAFDLQSLVEDELLMEIPLVPRHDRCPRDLPLSSSDADFEQAQQAKARPFDALAALREKGGRDDS